MLSFMTFGDKKRGEEAPSTLAKLSKTLAGVFKTKKDVDMPAAVGPCINPEELTAQKREWMDSQAAQVQLTLATWPEHLFEHFFVVGLPPDVEVTQIAEDLCAKERRPRQEDAEQVAAGGTAPCGDAGPAAHGGRGGSQSQAYDKAPRPAYDAKVLFRHPAAKAAPLNDQELVDLCFPHKVAPVKLRRSASMSSLHELVYGRQAASRDEQCFIFLLKVGASLPLYGICCAVPEVLHRPPHLARHLYPACRMPYRSVMISAPRVYCLLSHYPFFDLHFQVLHVILGMERLHRTIDFNVEMEAAAAAAAAQPASTGSGAAAACLAAALNASVAGATTTGGAPTTAGGASAGMYGTSTAGAGTNTGHADNDSSTQRRTHRDSKSQQQLPQQQQQQPRTQEQEQQEQKRQSVSVCNGVRLSSRCYCSDCADVMVEMYPGLLQRPTAPPSLRATGIRGDRGTAGLRDDGATTTASCERPSTQIGTGPLTHGSVGRRTAPGLPPAGDAARGATGDKSVAGLWATPAGGGAGLSQQRSGLAGGGYDGGDGEDAITAPVLGGAADRCQACGRLLGGCPSEEEPGQALPPGPLQEVPAAGARDQGLLEEVGDALEFALDKLATLPKAVVAGVNDAAAAAVRRLRQDAASRGGGCEGSAAAAAVASTSSRTTHAAPHTDMRLSPGPGSPRGALLLGGGGSGKELGAAPVEAVSALASKVRDTLLALGSGGTSGRRRLSMGDGGSDGGTGGGEALAGSAQRTCTASAADGSVPRPSSPAVARAAAAQVATPPPVRYATSAGGLATPPPAAVSLSTAVQRSRQSLTGGGGWRGDAATAAATASGMEGAGGEGTEGGVVAVPEDGQSVSLMQQLMKSVMTPVSPLAATVSLGQHTISPRGSPAASSIGAAVRSPSLPSSPREGCGPASPSPPPLHSQLSHPHVPAPGPSLAPNPPGHSWSFLNRLSRGGAGASRGASPSDHSVMSRDYDSVSSGFGGSGGGGGVSGGEAAGGGVFSSNVERGGVQGRGLKSAFATAVEQATVVGPVGASPGRYGIPVPPPPQGGMAAAATAVMVKPAASTLQPSAPAPPGPYVQNASVAMDGVRAGGADVTDGLGAMTGLHLTAAATAAAVAAVLPGGPGGRPHRSTNNNGVAIDDIVLSPAHTIPTSPDKTPNNDPALYGAVPPLPSAQSDPHSNRNLSSSLLPPRRSPRGFLGASIPHLLAESSAFSMQTSDASFYTAEGTESELPEAESTTTVAVTPAGSFRPSSACLPPWLSPAGSSSETPRGDNALGDNNLTTSGRRVDPQLSVQVPSQLHGSGAVVLLGGRPRAQGAAATATAVTQPPLLAPMPSASTAATANVRQSDPCGMALRGGSLGPLAVTGSGGTAPSVGPSRLGRLGVPSAAACTASEGGDGHQQQEQQQYEQQQQQIQQQQVRPAVPRSLSRGSSPGFPPPPAQQPAAAAAASKHNSVAQAVVPSDAPLPVVTPLSPLHHHTGGDGGGGEGGGGSSGGSSSSSGLASPPPAGVSLTPDMAHHFSPRHALDQLYNYPMINPGEQLTLRFGGVATLQFTRPLLGRRFTVLGPPRAIAGYAEAELAEGLQHWTTAVLCRSLSLENLLLLLSAALLERQLVVFCPAIALLTGCVLGLLPLLRPFSWQSLMLPVTPASMAGFLEAPVPFVLGVQYKTSEVKARCTHLVRVNVYKDKVKNAGAPLPPLPGLKRLTAALAPHHALLRRRLAHGGGIGGNGGSGSGGLGPAGSIGGPGGFGSLGSGVGGSFGRAASAVVGVDGEAAADAGGSLRSLSAAEHAAASAILATLANHLGTMCGDLRPHVITNVGLHKRTGVLMKESLLEVVPRRDQPFVRQFVDTQMFSVWSDAIISADCESAYTAS